MYTVSKKFRFSAGHVLPQHAGKCQNIHGHNYQIELEASADRVDSQGMVLDFGVLKDLFTEAIGHWDHKFLIAQPHVEYTESSVLKVELAHSQWAEMPSQMCVVLPIPETTAECLADFIYHSIAEISRGVRISRVSVEETPDSVAVYEPDPAKWYPIKASRIGIDWSLKDVGVQ